MWIKVILLQYDISYVSDFQKYVVLFTDKMCILLD